MDKNATEFVTVEIPAGSSNREIGAILEKKGLVKNGQFFNYYTKFKNYSNFKSGYFKDVYKRQEEPLPKRRPVRKPDFKEPIDKKSPANRYAEEARERAREDLKKKRTAPYLTTDPAATTSKRKKPFISERKPGQPTAPFQKENPGELLKYSKRLRQDQLILAEFESAGEPERCV